MQKISYHNITGLKFLNKVGILSPFYHFDSVTDKTHKKIPPKRNGGTPFLSEL